MNDSENAVYGEYAALLKPPTNDELAEAFLNSWLDPALPREAARIALRLVIDGALLESQNGHIGGSGESSSA